MPTRQPKPPDATDEFDALTQRMADHAKTLATEDATEDDLDRLAVALTQAALKPAG